MAEKQYVGVINTRNRTRVIEVEVNSATAKKAANGIGGWSLANPTEMAIAAKEKKSAKGAVDKTPAPAPETKDETPNGAEDEAQTEATQPEATQAPEPEQAPAPAPKKGGRPKKNKQ